MQIFNKDLNFDWKYDTVLPCFNFTIRWGIKTDLSVGDRIDCISDFGVSRRIFAKARVTDIQHMRFCDIGNYSHWHLSKSKKENGEHYNPLSVMRNLYGKNFNEKEIVTLIWFKVL